MKVFAPEFKALMTIFLSTGPVISTLLSSKPGIGTGPCHVGSSRICLVSLAKSGKPPASKAACCNIRLFNKDFLVGLKFLCKTAKKAKAAGVTISL